MYTLKALRKDCRLEREAQRKTASVSRPQDLLRCTGKSCGKDLRVQVRTTPHMCPGVLRTSLVPLLCRTPEFTATSLFARH